PRVELRELVFGQPVQQVAGRTEPVHAERMRTIGETGVGLVDGRAEFGEAFRGRLERPFDPRIDPLDVAEPRAEADAQSACAFVRAGGGDRAPYARLGRQRGPVARVGTRDHFEQPRAVGDRARLRA